LSSDSIKSAMGPQEWATLLFLSLLWGGSFFFIAVAVKELPPLTIVTCRVVGAAAVLWFVVALTRTPLPRDARIWRAFLVMGLFNNAIPFTLMAWGQGRIPSGLASILMATAPLFTVVVAGILLRDEKFTFLKVSGTLVGFGGTALMIGGDAWDGLGQDIPGQLALLGSALFYSFSSVFGRRFRTLRVPPIITAAGQVTASSLMLTPVMLLVDRPWTHAAPSPAVWASLAALAAVSTGFAYILYFRILASAGALNVLLVTFLVPVSAILLGWLVLGERLEPLHFAGMALIGLGLSAIDGRLWNALRR